MGRAPETASSHEPCWAECVCIKDAGDDPDITHGATIRVRLIKNRIQKIENAPLHADVSASVALPSIRYEAGPGVGHVTRPGLPLAVGEPAINPGPRRYIEANLHRIWRAHHAPSPPVEPGVEPGVELCVRIGIDHGASLALQTWNGRLGILGGLSVLGTTGIVIPWSCSAWLHAIHRGIDVARANGVSVLGAATGRTSEAFLQRAYGLSPSEILDMGDFVGGVLKYLRRYPVPHLVLAGGGGKLAKLAQGAMDLHSSRSRLDRAGVRRWLSDLSPASAARLEEASSFAHMLELFPALGAEVARHAYEQCRRHLAPSVAVPPCPGVSPGVSAPGGVASMKLTVIVLDRSGEVAGFAGSSLPSR